MTVEAGVTAESPTAENTAPAATQSAEVPQSTGANAESPTAKDETAAPSSAKDESLLDRVKAAIGPKKEGSSPSQGSQEAKPEGEAPSKEDEQPPEGDPTEEELSKYHSKTRARIRQLMDRAKTAESQVNDLKPDADLGRRITSHFSESGINPQEANLLLDIGRNLKKDPLKALEQIKPFYDALTRMSGDVLPADLQEAVTKGEITEAYARQLARTKTEAAISTQRTSQQDEQQRQRQAHEQTQQHAAAVGQAISTWEANQAKVDPDWSLKSDRLRELIELEIRRSGYPKTTADAVKLAETAKTKVNADFARFAPRKAAVSPVNPSSAARPAPAAPKTALEAARQRLADMATA